MAPNDEVQTPTVLVDVSGSLGTNASAVELSARLWREVGRVVVDISAVTFLGEAAYQVLLTHARRRAQSGSPLAVLCTDLMLLHELELTELDRFAEIARDAGTTTVSQPRQAA